MPSYLARPGTLRRHGAAVKDARVPRIAGNQGKTVSRIRMDVIGEGERQWQKLLKARRHLLIESGQRRANPRVIRHQCHAVDKTGRTEDAQRADISVRAEFVSTKDFTANQDDGRVFLVKLRNRLVAPYDVDDGRIKRYGKRLQFVQRPFVWLVVLSSSHEDRHLQQIEAKRRLHL